MPASLCQGAINTYSCCVCSTAGDQEAGPRPCTAVSAEGAAAWSTCGRTGRVQHSNLFASPVITCSQRVRGNTVSKQQQVEEPTPACVNSCSMQKEEQKDGAVGGVKPRGGGYGAMSQCASLYPHCLLMMHPLQPPASTALHLSLPPPLQSRFECGILLSCRVLSTRNVPCLAPTTQ